MVSLFRRAGCVEDELLLARAGRAGTTAIQTGESISRKVSAEADPTVYDVPRRLSLFTRVRGRSLFPRVSRGGR